MPKGPTITLKTGTLKTGTLKTGLLLLALALAACRPAATQEPDIAIEQAWARASVPGQASSAAYLTIRNRGAGDDFLVAVTSAGGRASLHSTSTTGGVMRMRELDRLEIPAGGNVTLEPASGHVMVTRLARPLAPGDELDLRLRFEKSGERTVAAEVRAAPGGAM